MLIRAGYEIILGVNVPTAMTALLKVHPSRLDDLRTEQHVVTDRSLPKSDYVDGFGNACTRMTPPATRSCAAISPILPRQIPKKLAVEMFLTGRRVDARRALDLGIVNRVTLPGQALAGARELAAEILAASPTSVRLSLTLLNETADIASENEAASHRSRIFDEMMMYEDVVEGVQAFVEKRRPVWRNR